MTGSSVLEKVLQTISVKLTKDEFFHMMSLEIFWPYSEYLDITGLGNVLEEKSGTKEKKLHGS